MVAAQIAEWAAEGQRLPVAVNLSARNLVEPDLERSSATCSPSSSSTPELLEFEITESAIVEDPEQARADAGPAHGARHRRRGRRLRHRQHLDEPAALDAARTLKIDRSFVTDLGSDAGGAVLVKAIIELAHEFNLIAVAEGVEEPEVTQLLARARLRRRPGLPLVAARSPRPSCPPCSR